MYDEAEKQQDGILNYEQFLKILENQQIPLERKTVDQLNLLFYPLNQFHLLNQKQFIRAMFFINMFIQQDKQIPYMMFIAYDVDFKQQLSQQNLLLCFKSFGFELNQELLNHIIDDMGMEEDDQITFQQYQLIVQELEKIFEQ